MMVCSVLLFICGAIFAVGYFIGYSAFKTSEKRVAYSVISGITALIVTGAVLFAGCIALMSGTSFH